jgi:hypothetical protein
MLDQVSDSFLVLCMANDTLEFLALACPYYGTSCIEISWYSYSEICRNMLLYVTVSCTSPPSRYQNRSLLSCPTTVIERDEMIISIWTEMPYLIKHGVEFGACDRLSPRHRDSRRSAPSPPLTMITALRDLINLAQPPKPCLGH